MGLLGIFEGSLEVVGFIWGLGSFGGRVRVARFIHAAPRFCWVHSMSLVSFQGCLGVVGLFLGRSILSGGALGSFGSLGERVGVVAFFQCHSQSHSLAVARLILGPPSCPRVE